MDEIKVVIRSAQAGDKNFIMSTWLRGQRFGNFYFREIDKDAYFKEYAKIITQILFLPGMEINVASDPANPSWIAGFAVLRGAELYWIHVKEDYRQKGIGHLLLGGREIKTVKAFTKVGRAIAAKKGLTFNPF